jgi:methylated-DNA-[protein]-cysteine S-methyltransferase
MSVTAHFRHPELGQIGWDTSENGLVRLGFGQASPQAQLALGDPLGVRQRLLAWFSGDRDAFTALPVCPAGTEYQQRVWRALRNIPFGQTRSYGALARELGSVARAVGTANGANPIAIVIPCHRVVGANGDLTGYAGGLDRKRWLLRHEGVSLPGVPGELF